MKSAILLSLVAVMSFVAVGCKEVNVVINNSSSKLIEARVEGPENMHTKDAMINPGTIYTFKLAVNDENLGKKYSLLAADKQVDFTVNKNTPPNIMFTVNDEKIEGPTFTIQD